MRISSNRQSKNTSFSYGRSFVATCQKIWESFRSLPVLVQAWVVIILFPINVASVFFLSEPMGVTVALLSAAGWLPNLVIVFYEKGFSKLMALPHLLPWTVLILLIFFANASFNNTFDIYLWLLAGINSISLMFDIPDSANWMRGERSVFRTNLSQQ